MQRVPANAWSVGPQKSVFWNATRSELEEEGDDRQSCRTTPVSGIASKHACNFRRCILLVYVHTCFSNRHTGCCCGAGEPKRIAWQAGRNNKQAPGLCSVLLLKCEHAEGMTMWWTFELESTVSDRQLQLATTLVRPRHQSPSQSERRIFVYAEGNSVAHSASQERSNLQRTEHFSPVKFRFVLSLARSSIPHKNPTPVTAQRFVQYSRDLHLVSMSM